MTNTINHVLVTGGAGYVGSALVPALLADGYKVSVYDICYFGSSHLPLGNENLKVVVGDIRDTSALSKALVNVDAVIHLACISNDASFELDENLSTSINFDCFEPMVIAAKEAGVKRFVYASSASVYGVSDALEIKEDHPLKPITLYNKYKGMCEPLLMKYQDDDFTCVTIRPSTVCGYAPRQRLDLSVNILTNHAINNGTIRVFGGAQRRPNLHIDDMVRLYQLLLQVDAKKIAGEVFNVGCENASIMSIAKIVKGVIEKEYCGQGNINIVTEKSDDIRSYHVNSDKVFEKLGFVPEHGIEKAVKDLCAAFSDNLLPESMTDTKYFNVQRMKELEEK